MSGSQPSYVQAESVDEACELLADHGHDAKVLAGGQSLSLLLRQDLLDPTVIVDVSEIPELGGIGVADGTVAIGAATTYNELRDHEVASTFGCLGDAVGVIADEQIRNLGTIGGAVAHADSALDILPPLRCLEATLVLAGPGGRREVPFEEFYTGYMTTELGDDEVVLEIRFEASADRRGSAYEKFANVSGGWATVGVGSRVELSADGDRIEEAHVVLAAVDDTPVRAGTAADVLVGSTPDGDTIDEAADAIPDDIDPLEDIAGSAEYKRTIASRLGRRSLHTALDRAAGGERA